MLKKKSILIIRLKPENREIAFGLLYPMGITTWEEKNHRQDLELRIQVPAKDKPDILIKKVKAREGALGLKIFKDIQIQENPDPSWSHKYQQFLKPFKLPTPHLRLSPIQIDPRGRLPRKLKEDTLYIQAQLAFGTGTHASTQLAAILLQQWLEENQGKRVLDIGCGTGILAMIARKRGSGDTWAVDNDPEALRITKQNFIINKIKGITLRKDLSKIRKKFSLVIANIIASQLIHLKPQILRCLRKDGKLILSGMTYGDVKEIKKHYPELKIVDRINQKGWTAFLLELKK